MVMAVLLAVAGCSGEPLKTLTIGESAPGFELKLLDGSAWSLDGHKGRPVVVAFMASWCPCTAESLPLLKDAHKRYNKEGLTLLALGIQDSRAEFEEFMKGRNVEFHTGYDKGDAIAHAYGIKAPPTMVFIGRDGVVKRVFYGNAKDVEAEFFKWFEEVL